MVAEASRFAGQVAVVTGGGRGIGQAIAQHLRAEGATVAIGDIEASGDGGGEFRTHLDVADEASCESFVAAVLERFGRIDILVNNAGILIRKPVRETEPAEWTRVLAVNLGGPFHMCRAAAAVLAETHGCVVNVGSTAGISAPTGAAAYSVSKAALLHLTRILAVEWAAAGVRVNAVAPTLVLTDMTRDAIADEAFHAAKLGAIPFGRLATPAEIAAAVVLLCDSRLGLVTGQVLAVDGGATLG